MNARSSRGLVAAQDAECAEAGPENAGARLRGTALIGRRGGSGEVEHSEWALRAQDPPAFGARA